ncbi:MAG TPA: CU044_2847 family protein [Terriglobales bacterium]|nr:CU044_2847 family protein [Terriglobales bacterium]
MTTFVPISVANGRLGIEVTELDGAQIQGPDKEVAGIPEQTLSSVMNAIEGIASDVAGVLSRVNPSEATIEFGVEVGLEAGQLTALLVKGTGKANFSISLKWVQTSQPGQPRGG